LEGAVGGVVYGVVTFLPQRVAGDELREEGHDEDGDIARECMRDHGDSQVVVCGLQTRKEMPDLCIREND
jgi:hypothetical protein